METLYWILLAFVIYVLFTRKKSKSKDAFNPEGKKACSQRAINDGYTSYIFGKH